MVLAARVAALEPRLPVADRDALDEPVLDEQLEHPVDARAPGRRPGGAELVLDLDRAQRARLARQQVDHPLARAAALEPARARARRGRARSTAVAAIARPSVPAREHRNENETQSHFVVGLARDATTVARPRSRSSPPAWRSPAAARSRPGAPAPSRRSSPPRTSGAASPPQLAGSPGQRPERHRRPRRGSALLRADGGRRAARWRSHSSRSSTGSATTPGSRSCWRPTRRRGRIVLTVGDLLGLQGRRQPAPLVRPRRRRGGGERDHRRPAAARPEGRRLLRPARDGVRAAGLARYHALIAQIRRRYAGVAVGASESIFALQAPALGLRLITPAGLHEGDQRGHRRHRAGHAHGPAPDREPRDQGVDLQLPERDARGPAAERAARAPTGSRSRRSPRRSRPPGVSFEQWQVAQLERLERALHEATGR